VRARVEQGVANACPFDALFLRALMLGVQCLTCDLPRLDEMANTRVLFF